MDLKLLEKRRKEKRQISPDFYRVIMIRAYVGQYYGFMIVIVV
jgi:hypothetical protein